MMMLKGLKHLAFIDDIKNLLCLMVTDKPILMSQQNVMDYITQELFLCFKIFSLKLSVPYSRGRISIFLLFVSLLSTKFCLQDEEVMTVPLSPPALRPSFIIRFALFQL